MAKKGIFAITLDLKAGAILYLKYFNNLTLKETHWAVKAIFISFKQKTCFLSHS